MKKMHLFEVFFSKRIVLLLLILVCLPLTILEQIHLKSPENTIFEIKEMFTETVRGPRLSRSLEGLKKINSAPCAKPGSFLNENRKNGRWYWYCYYNDRGNLAWMQMRCPNKRLFDPVIEKCVVNLTSTTETTLTTLAVTTSSVATTSSGPTTATTLTESVATNTMPSAGTISPSPATTPLAIIKP